MKSARERMDIVAAYEQVGTYRGAAALCGTTHKTVKRVIERRRAGESFDAPRRQLAKNTDAVASVIAEKVRATDGRISAKRLLPIARTAGYTGSARNFRRAVAEAKKAWRRWRRVADAVEHKLPDILCPVLLVTPAERPRGIFAGPRTTPASSRRRRRRTADRRGWPGWTAGRCRRVGFRPA